MANEANNADDAIRDQLIIRLVMAIHVQINTYTK